MDANQEEYLREIWYDPKHPASFAGPLKLYQVVKKEGKYKIGMKKIKQFLQNQDAYSLQRRVLRKNMKRRQVVVDGTDSLWQMDLAFFENISEYNHGIKFLLVVVDVFSRFLWVEPIKNRKAKTVIEAFQKILNKGRSPQSVTSDRGAEFYNKYMKAFLAKKKIHIYYTLNETKANYAERYIQTLRNRLVRMMTHQQSFKYVTILQDVVDSINHTPNRALNGRTPASVNKNNESEVRLDAYLARTGTKIGPEKPVKQTNTKKRKRKKSVFKLNIGDNVRISHLKRPFQRDYQQKWTEEIFIITDRRLSQEIPVYKLKDMMNDPVIGSFYEKELQRVEIKENQVWRIDKIIKKRKIRGQEEAWVSWLGYPKKFNSWIASSALQKV